jgi:hypothetical protein
MDLDKLQALSANVGALLQSRGAKLLERLKTGAELLAFRPQVLSVGELRLITTSLVAEGGYSFVYTARELMPGTEQGRRFALKKVIAQDAETLEIARAEQSLLATLPPHPHIVRYFGGSVEQRRQGGQELYMVLEYCPHGSLVDLVLPGAPVLSEARLLSVFHSVCKVSSRGIDRCRAASDVMRLSPRDLRIASRAIPARRPAPRRSQLGLRAGPLHICVPAVFSASCRLVLRA